MADIPASSSEWSLNAGSSMSFALTEYGDQSSNDTTLKAWGGLDRYITGQLQLGALLSYTKFAATSGSYSSFLLAVGPTFDLSQDPANAPYLGAKVGPQFSTLTSGRTYTVLHYEVYVGKKIELMHSVLWAPELSIGGHTEGTQGNYIWPSSRVIALIPFQLVVLF